MTEKYIFYATLVYAGANLFMIAVEYIGKMFGKPIEPGNVEKKAKTMAVASVAAVLIGMSLYVMPSVGNIPMVVCQYSGYVVFAAAFIMHHFYVEI